MDALRKVLVSNDIKAVENALESCENINAQNSDGETLLHLAMSETVSIDVVQLLFDHGASLTVENIDQKCPLHKIKQGKSDYLLNLLKIRQVQEARFTDGQTVLHKLVNNVMDFVFGIKNCDDEIEAFWKTVANDKEIDKDRLDINARDNDGETVFHTAANLPIAGRQLKPLLEMFTNFNPFAVDENGETFFHAYISRGFTETELTRYLFSGQSANCNTGVVKALLGIKNKYGDTPLHTYIKDSWSKKGPLSVDFEVYSFAEAGADLNATDAFGENVLHLMIPCLFFHRYDDDESDEETISSETQQSSSDNTDDDETQEGEKVTQEIATDCSDTQKPRCYLSTGEVIEYDDATVLSYWLNHVKYLLHNGADINAVNIHGETPLFLVDMPSIALSLIELGADSCVLDKRKQTPLIAGISKNASVSEDFLEIYISRKADVNHIDIFGNTALHYAAWNGLNIKIVKYLLNHGAMPIGDNRGQLPCQVAEFMGHYHLIEGLCQTKNHEHNPQFNRIRDVVSHYQFENNQSDVTSELQKRLGALSIVDLVTIPGLGHVEFTEEAKAIKEAVHGFATELSNSLYNTNPNLKNVLFQSGSVGENTKTGFPDEFDFYLILEKIGEKFHVDEEMSKQDQSFVFLKINEGEYDPDITDDEGYLNVFYIHVMLANIVEDCWSKRQMFRGRLGLVQFQKKCDTRLTAPTINLSLRWVGEVYKNLIINVDFVPACQIKGWWPSDAKLDGLMCTEEEVRSEGALLLLHCTSYNLLWDTRSFCRVSAIRAEKKHMLSLPSIPQKAYIACKVLCNLCPSIETVCTVEPCDILTSYMIKTCMFHVYHSYEKSGRKSELEKLDAESEKHMLHEFVIEIFEKLLKCSQQKKLPSFVLPWQNVFTFMSEHYKNLKRLHKMYRMTFVKMILNMLGKTQLYDDIDRAMWFNKSVQEVSDGYSDDEEEVLIFSTKRAKRFESIPEFDRM